ncbi:MAG: hypothetical protein R3244_02205, partial [Thermoanaerobaculia bacterium]|nr:hypothetical protein [Thermoanaerobaculia bacterium]
LSRERTEGARQALIGHHKMRTANWEKAAARVQFANRPYFPDALALFELEVDNTGRGGPELERWRQAARHRRTDGSSKRRQKKRRRRGGRRGRRRR